jgi:hypothetical protein
MASEFLRPEPRIGRPDPLEKKRGPGARPGPHSAGAKEGAYDFAFAKFPATSAQSTVFHHASMYSGRRFWYFR